MACKMDYVVVLDLEATCWAGVKPAPSEIIEFGVCKLHRDGKITDKRSIYIWPLTYVNTLSPYCTSLTGITVDLLKKHGMPFDGACNTLTKDYGPKHRIVAAWGNYDRIEVYNQCKALGLTTPLGPHHINVKELYAFMHGRKPRGLGRILKEAGMEFIGTPHSGADDAYNTARLLDYIRRGFDFGLNEYHLLERKR